MSTIIPSKSHFFAFSMEIIDLRNDPSERQKLADFIDTLKAGKDVVFQTSGSTGPPKQLSFSVEQIIRSVEITRDAFGLNNRSVLLCPFSMNYVAGKMMAARAWNLNAQLIFTGPTKDPFLMLSDTLPDFVALVPLQLSVILKNAQSLNMLNRATNIIIGGAPISHKLEKDILTHVKAPCYQTFGMTETLTHFAIRDILNKSNEFRLLGNTQITVDDEGKLSVYTSSAKKWLSTNDVVKPTSLGFRWLGRYDWVINSGGVKIHPEKVESALSELYPQIDFQLSFIHSDAFGQETVLMSNRPVNIEKSDLSDHLSTFEIPRYLLFVPTFPMLSNGKIDRLELQHLCEQASVNGLLERLH